MTSTRKTTADPAKPVVQLKRAGGTAVGPQRLVLLAAIAEHGSIAGAARAIGLSYKGAWEAVQALNNLFDRALVDARQGGAATVTAAGHLVLKAYGAIEGELVALLEKLDRAVAGAGLGSDIAWRMRMRTSARNMLRGKVLSVTDGAVTAEIVLDIGNGLTVTSIVTRESVNELELAPGREALALIKASFVILASSEKPIRTSARNQYGGTVIGHVAGAVSDEVALDIGGGKTIVATVTHGSGENIGFKIGDKAQALIKASHVIVAVD
jgi:molybdate transport system regulatory protein